MTALCPSQLFRRLLLCCLASVAFGITAFAAEPSGKLDLLLWRGADLRAAREALRRDESGLRSARDALVAAADQALVMSPPTVLEKKMTAASGDRRDYLSFGPYWWPDPAKPDGLPYVRRDGEVNHGLRHGSDDSAWGRMANAVEALALAYFFTGEERYAAKAVELVRVWFVDPATRMNPNFQHAQAIPGITDGRGIGIIEARQLTRVNESLALLAEFSGWSGETRTSYRRWLEDFYRWLRTSKNGRDEEAEQNNHGAWYDAQAAHLALVLDRVDDARAILTTGLARRLAAHIEPDGAQPLELARTNSFGYSLFNLEALFTCARLAEEVGVDWWNYTTPDGRSLHAAVSYLAPYLDPAKPWPKRDLVPASRSRLVPQLAEFLRHVDDPTLRALLHRFASTADASERWRLTDNQPLPLPEKHDIAPIGFRDAETRVYRRIEDAELRLHVVRPSGIAPDEKRPALVAFFGGGWSSGSPQSTITWARWAASLGLVGIAADYRTRHRHGAQPEDCVADGRAAVRWVAEHAAEFGIDPARLVVWGGSAGGHVAAWTAMSMAGPGPDDPAPTILPVAMILMNPVNDTTETGYGGPKRFGGSVARAAASSITHRMPARLPPAIVFHGTADETVRYANATAFRDAMVSRGSRCELITFEGLGHSLTAARWGEAGREADRRLKAESVAFLRSLGLLPTLSASNPVIPGFNPDPTICRVGEDFYVATSSFEYFPGVPLYHSRDLVNWRLIGHALATPESLNLDGIECSGGIYAPTLRHHDGTFYMITTLVGAKGRPGGNFVVTARDPAGPWSEPVWIKDAPGIDPSLFFDADGRDYYCGNDRPANSVHEKHRVIWIQEIDRTSLQLKGARAVLESAEFFADGRLGPVNNFEGPHLYRRGDFYYLLVSHGGTGVNHAVSVWRGRSPLGPWELGPANPIVTHRDAQDSPAGITCTGHADIVEAADGSWWMTLLAVRSTGRNSPMGRETFLARLTWENDWPVVNATERRGRLDHRTALPVLAAAAPVAADQRSFRDEFDGPRLGLDWTFIRTPRTAWWSVGGGLLRVALRPEEITELAQPSFAGVRVVSARTEVSTSVQFSPGAPHEAAGLVMQRAREAAYAVLVEREGSHRVATAYVGRERLGSVEVTPTGAVQLRLRLGAGRLSFGARDATGVWRDFAQVDAAPLSDAQGGRFTGTLAGVYGTSRGQPSDNSAEFDWFALTPWNE